MTKRTTMARRTVKFTGALLLVAGMLTPASGALAASPKDAPVTPATTIHGLPGSNPGHGGNSANPAGNGVNGGNGIHDIADGAPGWKGTSAANGGELPSCTMHGGLTAYNQNCD